jgi:hypothetical protein
MPENFDQKQENTGAGGKAETQHPRPAEQEDTDESDAAERDAEGHFVRGQSGNPAGRPRGSRNKDTVFVEQMFERFGGALANKAVNMALDGNMAAMRLCVSRIVAPRRQRASEFALPPLRTAADLAPAMAAIADGVCDGALSASEACELSQVVDAFGRALAAGDVEARLQRLEAVNGLAE